MTKDPVCGMMIDEKTAAGKSEYQGTTYYFCAPICKTRFDQNPKQYANRD
jgi:YHS domain-containing protein